jgi:hypothetical protein
MKQQIGSRQLRLDWGWKLVDRQGVNGFGDGIDAPDVAIGVGGIEGPERLPSM